MQHSNNRVVRDLVKKTTFVNHYWFHLMDPEWARDNQDVGPPPFGAQVILNGRARVSCHSSAGRIAFVKEGNCFTHVADPAGLAQVADTL